ncbi:MAG: CPBP family intramembrane metalloprotease [Methanobrevibacter olleyae]|uniref:CPBP family intramembrane metalloprotease n=1 Tax=Methanobrevibacter olleyae TaxID=294671 RepID=A0A8T3VLB7_METOL|nr:CPBP family intramembrane metalloprotease [Methanobrevibacter olleyae]
MDFNVTDFNVRLRTIRLREAVLAIAIGFILNVVLIALFPSLGEHDILLGIPLFCFVLLFFIWALRGSHGLGDDFSKIFERDNRREILYVFLINFLFVFLVVALFANFDILYGSLYPEMEPLLDFTPSALDPLSFILEVLSSIILAPIVEELFFRGVLFNRLKIRTGIIAAMIISSAIFAIGHEFGGITSAFLFGICMCIIYLKTDNILMTMSIHFLNNLVAVILEVANADAFLFQMPVAPITGIVSAIAGLLIIVYIFEEIKLLRA